MNQEIKHAVDRFVKAVQALEEGVNRVKDDLHRDGVIQRFEFTFELAWKTLKIVLVDQGVDCKTPKEILSEAF